MKKKLGLKLFLSYLGVLLLTVALLWLAIQLALPASFARHMGAASGGNGMMLGRGANADKPPLYDEFKAGVNEAIFWAAWVAVGVAALVSWLVSRRIVHPIRQMQQASLHLAAGHFDQHVPVLTDDELGDLARSFNHMAEELAQVETRRRRLIGDVAHELRTPLTAIQGYMEGLMDGVLPAEPETFAQIHGETQRLSRLIDDLQELSRIEAGAYSLNIQPVKLDEAVRTVFKRLGNQFEERSLTLQAQLGSRELVVLADSDRLVQILTNLLGNALHYTPAGGTVTVRAHQSGGQVEICVEDTGIGIPAEALPHIFERFYRVDTSRSRRRGGSGIGLTIVKHLVESQQGRIWAESPGEGQGSRFCFRLPAA